MMRMKAPAATKVYKGKRVTSKREDFKKLPIIWTVNMFWMRISMIG